MDAIRKMTLMPAERLQARVPAMRTKGRLRVGADADITVFDAAQIIDRSTYRDPVSRPSVFSTSSSTACRLSQRGSSSKALRQAWRFGRSSRNRGAP